MAKWLLAVVASMMFITTMVDMDVVLAFLLLSNPDRAFWPLESAFRPLAVCLGVLGLAFWVLPF